MTAHQETVKHVIDGVSIFTAFATLFQMLPTIAALFSIVWTGLRIIEMVTGKTIAQLIGRKKGGPNG
jgi:hypothetical protein